MVSISIASRQFRPHRFVVKPIATNHITLQVEMAGPSEGRLLIFLHGFPESSLAWRKQIPFFAERGFHVWAPDLRGYDRSDKPEGLASYRIDVLARDVVGLIDAAGRERALLVGHDWGAAVAWRVAQDFPERVERLAILNGPHPSAMARELRRNPKQLRKSWYMFFFQVPAIPERMLLRNGAQWLTRALRRSARAGTFDEHLLARYRTAWQQPGTMKAMLAWYRAALQLRPPRPNHRRITVPTLVIWGRKDAFLEPSLAVRSVERCDTGELVFIDEGTHWLPIEEAEQVNQRLYELFRAG